MPLDIFGPVESPLVVQKAYTLFPRDETSAPPAFELAMLEGPAAARIRALELLQDRPRYSSVEVCDADKSFIVERPSPHPSAVLV